MGEAASDVSGMHHVVSDDGDAGDHGGGKIDAHASSLSLSLSLSSFLSLSLRHKHSRTHTHSQTLSCQASFSVRFFSNRPDILFSFQFLFHFFISFLSPFFSGHRNFEFLNEMRALRHSKSSVKWLSGVWVEGGGLFFLVSLPRLFHPLKGERKKTRCPERG